MTGRTICALADAAAMPVMSFIKYFRKEFEEYIEKSLSRSDSDGRGWREVPGEGK